MANPAIAPNSRGDEEEHMPPEDNRTSEREGGAEHESTEQPAENRSEHGREASHRMETEQVPATKSHWRKKALIIVGIILVVLGLVAILAGLSLIPGVGPFLSASLGVGMAIGAAGIALQNDFIWKQVPGRHPDNMPSAV